MSKAPAKEAVNRTSKPAAKPAAKAPKSAGNAAGVPSGSKEVDENIAGLGDWRGATLAGMRKLIVQAVPDVVEEVKWRKPSNGMRGVAVWSCDGLVCTGETYKDKVKLTFARGAALPDPKGLFNGPGNGATRRSIDLREGEEVDGAAFKALVRAAVELNQGA